MKPPSTRKNANKDEEQRKKLSFNDKKRENEVDNNLCHEIIIYFAGFDYKLVLGTISQLPGFLQVLKLEAIYQVPNPYTYLKYI